MKQCKLLPFPGHSRDKKNEQRLPAPATSAASEEPGASGRLIVSVGKQRIAFDVACRATVLSAAPASVVVLPKRGEEDAMATMSELWLENCSLDVGERVVNAGRYHVRTRFLRLQNAVRLRDEVNGWRVCWLGGWDKGRIFFVVMVERKFRVKDRSAELVNS